MSLQEADVARSALDAQTLAQRMGEVAGVLRSLANERRLQILCTLVQRREANVKALAETIGLSQSAVSQHLARMRKAGLVSYRRERQTLWYRIVDPRIERVLAILQREYSS